jgi:hypothetical protein
MLRFHTVNTSFGFSFFYIPVVRVIFLDFLSYNLLTAFNLYQHKTEVNSDVEILGSSFYMEVICVTVIFYTFSICFIRRERAVHFFLEKCCEPFLTSF